MPKREPDADGFYETGLTAVSIQPNQMQTVNINGQPLIVGRYENRLVAFAGRCPHAGADLSQGKLYLVKIKL